MTRKNFYAIAMVVIGMMMGGNANAQGRGHGGAGHNGGGNREMHVSRNGGFEMRGQNHAGGHANEAYRGSRYMGGGEHRMADNRAFNGGRNHDVMNHRAPQVDNRGHVPGWEGRVRHDNGRWGYYRDNRWYWYDRYFEPDFYYGRPITYFNDYYYMTDGGYIPGWEGRVMYRNGRWGYLRGNDWYWYDRYYEPDYYFGHPVGHFHGHHVNAGRVVAGVAGAVVLGSLISALCH